ncbi:MAG: acetoacetate--CoA ligase, partial [Pseudomonadota bacterium]
RLRREIRELASPFHVPRRIHQVRDIPYTLNGKRVEKAVKSVVAGEPVKNRSSLINPECLDEYASLERSQAL